MKKNNKVKVLDNEETIKFDRRKLEIRGNLF